MTIFYTSSDIEELASSGITRLELGDGVKITDVARELAEELGIELARPGTVSLAVPGQAGTPQTGSRWNKPKGCQHGPLAARPGSASDQRGGAVAELVNIVSRLADQGG